MLNLRYIFRLIATFFSKFKIFIFFGIGFGVVVFFLLRFLIPSISFTQTVRIGEIGRYKVDSLPNVILAQIGNGLTKIDSEGNVVPDLALSWETTDKGKTWIFKLKEDLFWQDGTKVTSSTINYQFSDVKVSYPDDKIVVFNLENSYSAFPSVVSKPTFKTGLLGTGEWKVTKISLNGSVVENIYLASDDKRIIYKFYPTEDSAKTAFELGQVDRVEGIFDLSPFDTWPKIKVNKLTDTGEFVAVFFNTKDNTLAEKNLRQALSYAIDKSKLNGTRTISPISIDSWAYNPQVKPYDYDKTKAKQMVDDYKSTNKLSDLSINLTTSPLLLDKAEMIAKDWDAVGVNVNVQVISAVPTDYQAFLAIFDVPEDPDQYSIWHSTQTTTNITHYENPRIDKLLEDGRSQIDLESRKKTYLDFQRFLVEDSPAAFLYYPTTYTILRK